MTVKTETTRTETVPVKHAAEPRMKGDLAHAFHPWKMFEDFRDEMEELWRGRNWPTFPHFPNFTAKTTETWLPSTDVYRTNGDLIVKADLPGLKKEDVEVMVEDGFLVVRGSARKRRGEGEGVLPLRADLRQLLSPGAAAGGVRRREDLGQGPRRHPRSEGAAARDRDQGGEEDRGQMKPSTPGEAERPRDPPRPRSLDSAPPRHRI